MTSRREFCATTAAAVGGCLAAGPATAQSSTTEVTGTVESAVGTSLGDSHVVFVHQGTYEWYRAAIGSDGRFGTSLPTGASYDMAYFDQVPGDTINADFDGAPANADIGEVTVDGGTGDLGRYTVPEAYVIDIRIEDAEGNPLQGVPLSFYTQSGHGTGPGTYTTDRYGQVTHYESDRSGIELTGRMTVRTHPPGGDGQMLGTVFGNESKSVTMVLPNPGDYRNVIVREAVEGTATPGIVEDTSTPASADSSTDAPRAARTATPASSQAGVGSDGVTSRRGFFSNDADEPAALSNPMNLTVGGFVLSVGGIVYQMVGGK